MGKREAVVIVLALVAVGVAARLLPHVPNFAPVAATGLFCGAYLPRRVAIAAPIAIMLCSDYLLLYVDPFGSVSFARAYEPWELWHSALPYVYGSYAISAVVGWWLRSHRSQPAFVMGAALFCSVQFFLITNAGVWIGGAYDRGISGLYESYVMAIPFYRGTLAGDLLYTAVFFGLYELWRHSLPEIGRRVAKREEALAQT
jgi:hypothetical protein